MNNATLGSLLLPVALCACTTLDAADEVKDFQDASSSFSESLRAADEAAASARDASRLETYRTDIFDGRVAKISTECFAASEAANSALNAVVASRPYSAAAADAAYSMFGEIAPCDFVSRQPMRYTRLLDTAPDLVGEVTASGSATLSGTARRLEAYVAALADVATGETAGRTDAARSKLVAAGKGLLAAVRVSGPVDQLGDLVDAGISLILAAKRNAVIREFLNRMDPAMPVFMERVGTAARVQHGQAALERARAAEAIADWGNRSLNAPNMTVAAGRGRKMAAPARLDLFDDVVARLNPHNEEFLKVTSADPMAAARAFASAHHELTAIYNDPRANRAALAEGLGKFTEAAAALHEALEQADGGNIGN